MVQGKKYLGPCHLPHTENLVSEYKTKWQLARAISGQMEHEQRKGSGKKMAGRLILYSWFHFGNWKCFLATTKQNEWCRYIYLNYVLYKITINSLEVRSLSRQSRVFLKKQIGKAFKIFKQFLMYGFQNHPDITQEQRKASIFPWMGI